MSGCAGVKPVALTVYSDTEKIPDTFSYVIPHRLDNTARRHCGAHAHYTGDPQRCRAASQQGRRTDAGCCGRRGTACGSQVSAHRFLGHIGSELAAINVSIDQLHTGGCRFNDAREHCTVTSLTNNGTINFNGHTITLADGTVLR